MNRRLRTVSMAIAAVLLVGSGCTSGGTGPGDVAPDPPLPGTWRTEEGLLRDGAGRAVWLRGVNYPVRDRDFWNSQPTNLAQAELDQVAASGLNAIRLVINWDRIEPDPDRYDADYVALVADLARQAWGSGLLVVVDLHQDLFGIGFGLHGAPRWACDESLYASFQPIDPFFFNYFSREVSGCFDAFWKDRGLWGHHARAAREVARALVGNEGVLGFDPINEPFPGTIPFEEFEADYLGPFYQEFDRVVQEALPGSLVFFEPSVLVSVQQATTFREAPAPSRSYLLPHYYNPSVETAFRWDEDVSIDRGFVQSIAAEARRLGVPWGLGEMGGDLRTSNLGLYLRSLYGLLDEAGAGAFPWIFVEGTSGFALRNPETGDWHPSSMEILRPSPSRLSGPPTRVLWDPEARRFDLEWVEDPRAGDSEVLWPERFGLSDWQFLLDGEPIVPEVIRPGLLRIPAGPGGPRSFRVR